MELQLLGPIRVLIDGSERPLAGRQPALLGLLAIHAPAVVSTGRLVEAIWPDQLPRHPANALQGRVSQLRKVVDPRGAGLLQQRDAGYRLHDEFVAIDRHRFEELAASGHRLARSGQDEEAAEHLDQALAMWHGQALEGFATEPWAIAEVARLEELRLTTWEDRMGAALALGEHRRIIADLEAFVHDHPLRDRPRGQLMLALYRAGRQADALQIYQRGRRQLRDELGIDPSPQLRDLERRILEQDPNLDRPAPAAPPAPTPSPTPPATASPAATVTAGQPGAPVASGSSDPDQGELAVGRGPESRVLWRAWNSAASGSGQLVVMTGEAGIGKSHLTDALRDRLSSSGTARATIGRSAETEGAPPFWPWIQVVRSLVEDVEPALLPHLLGAGAAPVAQIVPELRALLPDPVLPLSAGSASARFQVGDAVAGFLTRLAATQPLLVLIEDLQHADAPSLDLLDLLADRLSSAPLLLVVTLRETTDERVVASLNRLLGRPSVIRVSLTGLSVHSTGRLLTRHLGTDDETVATALHQRTGGNPLFLTELLRLATADDVDDDADGTDRDDDLRWARAHKRMLQEIPGSLRGVIGTRLAALPTSSLEVLQATAVVGREAPTTWIAEMLDLDLATVLDRFHPAVEAGIVASTDGWNLGHRFEHILVRDTVLAQLSIRRRAELHAAAARVLEQLTDARTRTAVAHHLEQAVAIVGVAAAVDAAMAAADEAARLFAVEQATAHLEDALRLLRLGPSDPRRELALNARLAFVLQETDGFLSPRVREAAHRVRMLAGSVTDAPEVIGGVYSLWAYWMNLARYADALEVAEELLAAAERTGDLATRLAGHFTRGQARFLTGSVADAEADLLTASDLVDRLDPKEATARGLDQVVLDARVGLGHPLWLRGNDAVAEERALAAIARAEEVGNHYASAHGRLFLSWLHAVRGDAERTLAWTTQTLERCERHGFGLVANVAGPFHGWALAATGEVSTGIERITSGIERLDESGFQMLRPLHLGLLAAALEEAGRSEDAAATLEEAIRTAERTGERVHLPALHRQRVRLRTAWGSPIAPLLRELEAAIQLAEAQRSPRMVDLLTQELATLDEAT